MILAQFAHLTSQAANLAMFDDQPVDFSLLGLWAHMGYFAKGIAVVLFIMSIWSRAVLSPLPVRTSVPSGLNATAFTGPL